MRDKRAASARNPGAAAIALQKSRKTPIGYCMSRQAGAAPLDIRPHGDAGLALASNAVAALSPAAFFIVIVKLGSAEMAGAFGLALAAVSPVMLLARLQTRSLLVAGGDSEFSIRDYFGLRLVATATALAGIAIWLRFSNAFVSAAATVFLVAVVKGLENGGDIAHGTWQRAGRWRSITAAVVLRAGASWATLGIGLALWDDLTWALALTAASSAIVLLGFEIPLCRRRRETAWLSVPWADFPRRASRLAVRAAPLGFAAALISLNLHLPRILLERHQGLEEVAYYTGMAQLLMPAGFVMQALGQTSLGNLALWRTQDPAAFRHRVRLLLGAAAVLGLGAVCSSFWWGEALLRTVYNPAYANHASTLPWIGLALCATLICSALGFVLTASGLFRAQVPIYLAATIVTWVAGSAWIPVHGLHGAAYASLAGWMVAAMGSAVAATKNRRAMVRQRRQAAEECAT